MTDSPLSREGLDALIAENRRHAALMHLVLMNAGLAHIDPPSTKAEADWAIALLEGLATFGDPDAIAVIRRMGCPVPPPLHPVLPEVGECDLLHEGVVQTIGRRLGRHADTVKISGCSPAIDGEWVRAPGTEDDFHRPDDAS